MKDRGISPTSTISPGSSRLGSPETAPTSPESPPKKRKRSPDDEGDDKLEYVDKLESKEPRLDDKVEAKKPKIVKTEAKKPKVDKKAEAKKPNPKEQPDPSTASSCKKWTSLEASLDDKEGKRARFEEPSHALNIAYKDDEDQVDWGEDDDL